MFKKVLTYVTKFVDEPLSDLELLANKNVFQWDRFNWGSLAEVFCMEVLEFQLETLTVLTFEWPRDSETKKNKKEATLLCDAPSSFV